MLNSMPPGYITLSQWNIVVIVVEGQTIEKFLGFDEDSGTFRISSQIIDYDAANDTGRTVSGSIYRFIDKPGKLHSDPQKVFDALNIMPNVTVFLKYPDHYDA